MDDETCLCCFGLGIVRSRTVTSTYDQRSPFGPVLVEHSIRRCSCPAGSMAELPKPVAEDSDKPF